MHLSDGQLRAHLDGQLDESEARHLEVCPECRARLAPLAERVSQVSRRLARLGPEVDDPRLNSGAALARFSNTRARARAERKDESVFSRIFAKPYRPAWGLLAALALVIGSLSFVPVRAWAGEFLGLFRVQQITVLPVDTTRLSQLTDDSSLGKQLGQLLSDSVTVTKEPGEPRAVAGVDEASRLAGFNVRLLGESPDGANPTITVQDGAAFEFVVDRDRAQALLDDSGVKDIQLPASLEDAVIAVDIPAGVTATYGDCPDMAKDDVDPDDYADGNSSRLRNCVALVQIPGPTVSTPPDLDVARLAELGLQFTGMTAEEARAFSQTVDWTSTLVVPIPRNGMEYEQVAVDGVTGNLITRGHDGAPSRYTILWVKDGIVYALAGFGDPDSGVAMANSLK